MYNNSGLVYLEKRKNCDALSKIDQSAEVYLLLYLNKEVNKYPFYFSAVYIFYMAV